MRSSICFWTVFSSTWSPELNGQRVKSLKIFRLLHWFLKDSTPHYWPVTSSHDNMFGHEKRRYTQNDILPHRQSSCFIIFCWHIRVHTKYFFSRSSMFSSGATTTLGGVAIAHPFRRLSACVRSHTVQATTCLWSRDFVGELQKTVGKWAKVKHSWSRGDKPFRFLWPLILSLSPTLSRNN